MGVTSYIHEAFDPKQLKLIVARAIRTLRKVEFDAIAVRGVSGMLVGPTVATALGKHIIIVRKDKKIEPSHYDHQVESMLAQGTYIILDDFVGVGTTQRVIREEIFKLYPNLKPVGFYAWRKYNCSGAIENMTGLPNYGLEYGRE